MTADHLRRSPLADLADTRVGPVRLREEPFLAQHSLRLRPGGAAGARAADALGAPLPTRPGTVAEAGDLRVLCLGPDEWLVVGPDGSGPDTGRRLRAARPPCVVDVSADRTALDLSGPGARAVLAHGCALDLHPRVFGPGRCARTPVFRVAVVLDQRADTPAYRLLVGASFARHLADRLVDVLENGRMSGHD